MTIGNRTNTPRAIFFAGKYLTIPPMGFVEIEDTSANREALESLKHTQLMRILLDSNVLVLNEKVTLDSKETKVEGPTPPQELTAEPAMPRVHRGRPRKTAETVKV